MLGTRINDILAECCGVLLSTAVDAGRNGVQVVVVIAATRYIDIAAAERVRVDDAGARAVCCYESQEVCSQKGWGVRYAPTIWRWNKTVCANTAESIKGRM